MYSHVACDVMKERTLYLLKPSSLIWHLMPYLFLLSLKGMPHCVTAQFMIYWLRADAYDTLGGTFISQRKEKIQTSSTNQVFHACSAPFHARVH